MYSNVANPPIPQPINRVYPRFADRDTILALDMQDGVPGLPRTNLLTANQADGGDTRGDALGWGATAGNTPVYQTDVKYQGNGCIKIAYNNTGSGLLTSTGYRPAVKPGEYYAFSARVRNDTDKIMSLGFFQYSSGTYITGTAIDVPPNTPFTQYTYKRLISDTVDTIVPFVYLKSGQENATGNVYYDMLGVYRISSLGADIPLWDNSPAVPASLTRLLDGSGRGNHVTPTGITPVKDLYGLAQSFDGVDDKGDAGNPVSLNVGSSDFSIEVWVKLKSVESTKFILGKADGVSSTSSKGYVLYNDSVGTKLTFGIWDGANNITVPALTNTVANQWYHIVGVREGSKGKLYINGNLVNTMTNVNTGNIDVANNFTIGNVATLFCDCLIKELCIHRRIISAQEALALYRRDAWRVGLRG